MEETSKFSVTGFDCLQFDISKSIFGNQKMVKEIIKPMTYNDLTKWESLRFPADEFQILKQMCHTNQHNEALTKYDPIAFKMNRYSDIIPCKFSLELNTNTYQPIS